MTEPTERGRRPRSTGRYRLHKLQATGNDFLVCDPAETGASAAPITAPVAAALCDRRFGVGADGLIVLGPPHDAGSDVAMVLRNADGGTAEMSGNGIRALAWLAHRLGYGEGGRLRVETAAGTRIVEVEIDPDRDEVVAARVGMGPVTFEPGAIPVAVSSPFGIEASVGETAYEGDAAGMGNPHLVLVVDDPGAVPVAEHGPVLEADERFPRRTNVEFVAPAVDAGQEGGPGDGLADRGGTGEGGGRRGEGSDGSDGWGGSDRSEGSDGSEGAVLTMRVWERGVGETLSCGTGACAAAAVARRRGLVGDGEVTVRVPGGELTVDLSDAAEVWLGGPVVHVFETTVDLTELGAANPPGGAERSGAGELSGRSDPSGVDPSGVDPSGGAGAADPPGGVERSGAGELSGRSDPSGVDPSGGGGAAAGPSSPLLRADPTGRPAPSGRTGLYPASGPSGAGRADPVERPGPPGREVAP